MKMHRPGRRTLCLVVLVLLCSLASALAADRDPTDDFVAMATAGAAYLNDSTQCPGIINANTVLANLDDYTVIDIRAESAYVAGHIPGAYHSSLATLVDDLATRIPTGKPYILAGYSGMTSNLAKIAMELLGYDEVYALLFGMSSWHPSLDVWTYNCGNTLGNPETVDQNGNLIVHEFPALEGTIAERVAVMLAGGFKGRSYTDIQDNLDDYFIINYFGVADYLGQGTSGVPGHIPGAFQFTPYASLGLDQMLESLPTDRPLIVYDWTGQHATQVTAFLNMLGYDAYCLKFGANNLFYDDLTAHRWNGASFEGPLENGSGPTAVDDVGVPLVASVGNHPNPFNPATTIAYRLTGPAAVTLRIYDLSGRLVRELARDVVHSAGSHDLTWRGRNDAGQSVASGTYVYRLEAGAQVESRRLTLLK